MKKNLAGKRAVKCPSGYLFPGQLTNGQRHCDFFSFSFQINWQRLLSAMQCSITFCYVVRFACVNISAHGFKPETIHNSLINKVVNGHFKSEIIKITKYRKTNSGQKWTPSCAHDVNDSCKRVAYMCYAKFSHCIQANPRNGPWDPQQAGRFPSLIKQSVHFAQYFPNLSFAVYSHALLRHV